MPRRKPPTGLPWSAQTGRRQSEDTPADQPMSVTPVKSLAVGPHPIMRTPEGFSPHITASVRRVALHEIHFPHAALAKNPLYCVIRQQLLAGFPCISVKNILHIGNCFNPPFISRKIIVCLFWHVHLFYFIANPVTSPVPG